MPATAIVTDPVVTRSGPPTALPVTEGFRDVPRIRDEHRLDMFDPRIEYADSLVLHARTFGFCRRKCRQAGRVGKCRHSRSAFEGRECP